MDGHSRWTSRKFWASMIAEVAGIIALLGGNPGEFQTIAGAVLTIAVALNYVRVEGAIDAANKK